MTRPQPPSGSRQRDEYAGEVGPDAAARQAQEARERHVCCGEWKPDHHPMCRNYIEPSAPTVIEGQETLL